MLVPAGRLRQLQSLERGCDIRNNSRIRNNGLAFAACVVQGTLCIW